MTEPELPGYDLTGYLADQIDAFAGMIEQRDLARSVAVGLEGELHAVTTERDALIAQLHEAERRIDETLALCERWARDPLSDRISITAVQATLDARYNRPGDAA